jgi:hypothetical protein
MPATGVAQDVGVARLQAQGPGRVQPGIHAGQDDEVPGRPRRPGGAVELDALMGGIGGQDRRELQVHERASFQCLAR